jgi:nuclear pore complex protein Nup210
MFLVLVHAGLSDFRISHLNARLPFKSARNSPVLTLTASSGCVKWSVSNLSILAITPISEAKCSTAATIVVLSQGPGPAAAHVTAESSVAGHPILKCDIFIDTIHSISILATTHSLYAESSLEVLTLQATDSANNTFTSLDGMDVTWAVDRSHIRVINSDQAKVLRSDIGPRSSASLIVQGTTIGPSWVTASVNGISTRINLSVVEPIRLIPAPIVRTLPHHFIPFRLCSTRNVHGGARADQSGQPISLPSPDYRLSSSESGVLTIAENGNASTHRVGVTTVTATDLRMVDNVASTLVHVRYPAHAAQPDQYIAIGDDPVFAPVLADENGNSFDMFGPIVWQAGGNWRVPGRALVDVAYYDYHFSAVVIVCEPIEIEPTVVTLPVGYTGFRLNINGGSGEFSFTVENPIVAYVENVTAAVNALNYGATLVTVQDRRIAKYRAVFTVVVKPMKIGVNLAERELLVGEKFSPFCVVTADSGEQFSVNVPLEILSDRLDVVRSDLIGSSAGFARIFCQNGSTASEKVLVSVVAPLMASIDGIMTPHSLFPILKVGGVQKWPDSSDPRVDLECPGAVLTSVDPLFRIDREYNGICSVNMVNPTTALNPRPLVSRAEFHLIAANAAFLRIHVWLNGSLSSDYCHAPPPTYVHTPDHTYHIIQREPYDIGVTMRTWNGTAIKYHSNVPIALQGNGNDSFVPLPWSGPEGATRYRFPITADIVLTAVSPSLEPISLQLQTFPRFIITGGLNQTQYYNPNTTLTFRLSAGSGYFNTTARNARIGLDNDLLFLPERAGHWEIDVIDQCSRVRQRLFLATVAVHRLEIIVRRTVRVNTSEFVVVHAYDNAGRSIPDSLLEVANLTLYGPYLTRNSPANWIFSPTVARAVILRACAGNGMCSPNVTVTVLRGLSVSPLELVLVPGEECRLNVSGAAPIGYNMCNRTVAIFTGSGVRGLNPGETILNVTVKAFSDFDPVRVRIVVLDFELVLTRTSAQPTQTGLVGLLLRGRTARGTWLDPPTTAWTFTPALPHKKVNESYVFVNCTQGGVVNVTVTALSRVYTELLVFEPKLTLLSPPMVLLAPGTAAEVSVADNVSVRLHSLDESIARVDGVWITAGALEGSAVVQAAHGSQGLAVAVRVALPQWLHVWHVPPHFFQLLLLDPNGLRYTTGRGITYALTGENFSCIVDHTGLCRSDRVPDSLSLTASAGNPFFNLSTHFALNVVVRLAPANVTMLRGNVTQFHCSAARPSWFIKGETVANVTRRGTVTALQEGTARLSCAPGVETDITVVALKDIELHIRTTLQEFEVRPRFSRDVASHREVRNDVELTCVVLNKTRGHCGIARAVINATGWFCEIDQLGQCGFRTILGVSVASAAGRMHLDRAFIVSQEQVLFGIEREVWKIMKAGNRTVSIPLKLKKDEVSVNASRGLSLEFVAGKELALIKADRSFKFSGRVEIVHKDTDERAIVHIELQEDLQAPPLLHQKDFYISQDLIFYVCLFGLFAAVAVGVFALTT